MRIDWVPASAASLIAGVIALALGATMLPQGDNAEATLELVRQNDGRWMAVSVLFFVAAAALTLGLPAILTLFRVRGALWALCAVGVFAVGCIGTAGYAMVLAFFRSLVLSDAVRGSALEDVTREVGLASLLLVWVVAFYLGELLFAIAFLRSGSVPRWVPVLLLAHVVTLPLGRTLPLFDGGWTIVLMAVAFAGIAITANSRETRVRAA